MTILYITLWYALNIGYNIYNKDLCNNFGIDGPLAWTVGMTSLGAGMLYVIPVWYLGFRPIPKMDAEDVKNILIIAALHTAGHYGAVVSMSLGAVTFTHIVKAAEPVFSTIFTGLILGKWAAWQVNLSLVPVILGVVIASVKISFDPSFSVELGEFNVQAFAGAMISNIAFALRSIYMKQMDNTPEKKAACKAKNLTSANIYAVYTLFAFMISIPLTYVMEGSSLFASGTIDTIVDNQTFNAPSMMSQFMSGSKTTLMIEMHIITGLFFYLYNEASSLALGNLDGVAHAVCNTVKRVVIMVAMSLFDKPLTLQKWTGAGIAIGGTLVYTLVKSAVEKAAKAKKA